VHSGGKKSQMDWNMLLPYQAALLIFPVPDGGKKFQAVQNTMCQVSIQFSTPSAPTQ